MELTPTTSFSIDVIFSPKLSSMPILFNICFNVQYVRTFKQHHKLKYVAIYPVTQPFYSNVMKNFE